MKRKVELVVISDTHLGTYGCHAKELYNYLKSIKPEVLVLNGDIIDMWQFKKSYFPKEHLLVVNRLLKLLANGTKIYYITGNHDDALRRFTDFSNGNFSLRNQLVLQLGTKRYCFFHGDLFDTSITGMRWIAQLGGKSYDWLILINRFINRWFLRPGARPTSFAHSVKHRVKKAVKFINDFEEAAIRAARTEGFDGVVCGHVHKPILRHEGDFLYLNSGDWVENLTALEYNFGEWSLFQYNPFDFENADDLANPPAESAPEEDELSSMALNFLGKMGQTNR